MAEHQVMSCLHSNNSYTNDFVSHHALVRGLGGYAATPVEGTGTDRAFLAMLTGRPWVVVTVPALVPCARV